MIGCSRVLLPPACVRARRYGASMGHQFVGSMAAGAAVGTAAGGVMGMRSAGQVVAWARGVREADAQLLEQGHTQLSSIAEPESQGYRKERHVLVCYGGGMLLGGFLVWLVVGIAVAAVGTVGNSEGEAVMGQLVIGALFFGGVAGLAGLVVPGLIFGSIFWMMESRARLEADKALTAHAVWSNREELRQQLDSGAISPGEALRLLRGDIPETLPLEPPPPAMPLPEAGQPATPMAILALACAVATHGYVRSDSGDSSTPSRVQRLLKDPDAPERGTTTILSVHTDEAEAVFAWALGAYDAPDRDEFRERVGYWAAYREVEPSNAEAVRILAAGVGGYRRAQSLGRA